ncbi:flippase-like domain-containing protein [bacterium]|nr:flippase-like domain-containing protein [bacterium]
MNFIKKNFAGIIFSLFFLIIILHNLNFEDFFKFIAEFNYFYLAIFIIIYLLNLCIKTFRWSILLQNKNVKKFILFFIYSIGNAFNICMPFRFGDFWKAYRYGQESKLPISEVFGTVIVERLSDFLSTLFVLFFIVFRYFKNDFTLKLLYNTTNLAFIALLAVIFLLIISKYFKKFSIISEFISGIKKFGNFKNFIFIFCLSLLTRMLEAVFVYTLIIGSGLKIGFSAALFVIVFNALAGIIPSVSNYIGAYQYSYILALGIYGISKTQAFAIVTIYEFVTLITLIFIASLYFIQKLISDNSANS